MTAAECMRRRKSVRSFKAEPCAQELLDGLVDYISPLEAPEGGIDWDFDLLPYGDMAAFLGSEPQPRAPYYLVLRAERVAFSLQNMGYIGYLACLHLAEKGIGTCFMGGLSPQNEFENVLAYVIAIALGIPYEPLREPDAEPDRLPVSRTVFGETKGDLAGIFELVRLAPSAFNRQPIRYMSVGGKVHVFRKHVPLKWPPTSFVQCIDAGVAMAAVSVAAGECGYNTRIVRIKPEPKWGRMIYQATIQLEKPL